MNHHKRNLYLILIIFAVSFIISIIIIFSKNKEFHYYNENFSSKSWKYGTTREEFREFSRWYK